MADCYFQHWQCPVWYVQIVASSLSFTDIYQVSHLPHLFGFPLLTGCIGAMPTTVSLQCVVLPALIYSNVHLTTSAPFTLTNCVVFFCNYIAQDKIW